MFGLPDFTVGGTLRRFFGVVRHHVVAMLVSSLVLYAAPVVVLGFLAPSDAVPSADAVRAAAGAHRPALEPAPFVGFLAVSLLVQTIGFTLAAAVVVWVAHEDLYGRSADAAGAVAAALRVLPAAVVMYSLTSVATGLAALLLIVPGVMLFCRWCVAFPVLVVERAGVLGSLGRSRDLTRHHRWAVLGFLLVVGLMGGAVALTHGIVGSALGGAAGGTAGVAIRTAFGLLANAAIPALNGASGVALYAELRRAGEGVLSSDAAEAFA